MSSKQIIVSGSFDDLRSKQIRLLEKASKLGELTVLLWQDAAVRKVSGSQPRFPENERQYLLEAIRFVSKVKLTDWPLGLNSVALVEKVQPQAWITEAGQEQSAVKEYCAECRIEYRVIPEEDLLDFPDSNAEKLLPATRKKVLVTGSFDWFHSGHVRFFEEVSAYGDLYVVVGHDANIRLLKGEGHPMHPQEERRYVVSAIRFVRQALISTGNGWLDAEPEIERIKPDIYAVNEDGDKGGKREYCEKHRIEYLVLKRTPAPGLPARTSTDLRGF